MSAPVRTVLLGLSARDASEIMRSGGLQRLVVVDDNGRIAGVVSDRDLRAAQPSTMLVRDAVHREKALSLLKVAGVMTAHPHPVRAGDSVREALLLMRRHKVGSLPVVDDGRRPIGILTGFDVLDLALKLLPERSEP